MSLPVSIVIPVHNGRPLLEKLLESIRDQTQHPLEVIVVDNGSTDGAAEFAERNGARVISMGRNTGFAIAVNRGICEAKGQGIALLNSDVVLDRRWLETLWLGLCGSACDFATGKILQAGSDTLLDGTFDLICRGACAWRAGAGRIACGFSQTPRPVQFCSATAAIYTAELFQNVGNFEESFESYLEDVDFGLRCAKAGRRGGYFPDAICRHLGSATFGRWNSRVVRLISRNQVWLIARHYPVGLIRRWFWPILVAQFLWGALAIRHGCGIAWLLGKAEALRSFSVVRRQATESPDPSAMIGASEREIHQLQSEIGFDLYWKWYFRLAGVAKDPT